MQAWERDSQTRTYGTRNLGNGKGAVMKQFVMQDVCMIIQSRVGHQGQMSNLPLASPALTDEDESESWFYCFVRSYHWEDREQPA